MMTPTPEPIPVPADPGADDRIQIAAAVGVLRDRGRPVEGPRHRAPHRQTRTWVRRILTLGLAR